MVSVSRWLACYRPLPLHCCDTGGTGLRTWCPWECVGIIWLDIKHALLFFAAQQLSIWTNFNGIIGELSCFDEDCCFLPKCEGIYRLFFGFFLEKKAPFPLYTAALQQYCNWRLCYVVFSQPGKQKWNHKWEKLDKKWNVQCAASRDNEATFCHVSFS